jgi:hypothetical protein
MPINNPSYIENRGNASVTAADTPPNRLPVAIGETWFNKVTKRVWISTGMATLADWEDISVDIPPFDLTVFDKILVADGQVLTDGNNVLYRS